MTASLYGKGREGFLGGDIDWDADIIKVVAIDTANYSVSIDADEFLADIPAAARVSISDALTSKTKALGVAGAANVVFQEVTGADIEAIALYQDTGNEATSRLIAYNDESADLPIPPNGGDINLNWDAGVNKIFKL
ncbi:MULTISPECIES: hypothetical protein [unclassified Methylophaga]|jgi:hypothetical protein|uniref:hypothetical protein n=1 Tax=unclassified Methylophaga TaxID=2629249 RepID=UPI00259CFEEA|nr:MULTISPECIES: hypothetical protein [unclassified Methylophaga]|tara:strand:+ start:22021 stop:22428 length:408 start_codon:yes stop_codon:yes gene_type:complete